MWILCYIPEPTNGLKFDESGQRFKQMNTNSSFGRRLLPVRYISRSQATSWLTTVALTILTSTVMVIVAIVVVHHSVR